MSVSVWNPDAIIGGEADAYEGPPQWASNGGFWIHRTPPPNGFQNDKVAKVRWRLESGRKGDATRGLDYAFENPGGSSDGVAQFQPGEDKVWVPIVRPVDDSILEPPETVRLVLEDGENYDLPPYPEQRKAQIYIFDDDGGPEWPEEDHDEDDDGDPDPYPLPPPDPDDERPDFTANLTVLGKGGNDSGTTDPTTSPTGNTPATGDGSGTNSTSGQTRNVFIPLNDDFDEQNKNASGDLIADTLPDHAAGDRLLGGDDEVHYGTLALHSDTASQTGRWVLNYPSSDIAVWASGPAVNSPSGYRKLQPGESFSAASLPLSVPIAVEGLSPSFQIDDVPLQVTFIPAGANATPVTDTIKLTVVQADLDVE